jgi:hypothetical protein
MLFISPDDPDLEPIMDPVQSLKNIEALLKAASQSGDIATIERFVAIAQEFIDGVRPHRRSDRPLAPADLLPVRPDARTA